MVIGLEVHAELATATKIFCACPNRFGDEPNTNICPVCLGLPGQPAGAQPSGRRAGRSGSARRSTARCASSIFHRKNYFYPDMPKDYQISQYDQPINVDGWLELPSGKRIGIERAHIEEDTGKSTHLGDSGGRIHGSDVTASSTTTGPACHCSRSSARPDIRSAEEARQYVTELRAILVARGVSDAKMEEGSMRVDANVSVRRAARRRSAPAARSRT